MQSRYLIVADDFTGANDTGVQLRRRGKPTYVTMQGMFENLPGSSLVIDTESRNCSEERAALLVQKALGRVSFDTFDVVMKKIDSTLRGNIASEVKAVDVMFGSEMVLVAASLPDLGRVTREGRQYVHGVPILETEHANDPIKPVKEDNLVRLLKETYQELVTSISVEQIREGALDFSNCRVFVCDAETNEDMRMLVRAVVALQRKVLYVGTAALADHLCERENPVKPALALIASLNQVTKEQVIYAQKAGIASVVLPIAELLSSPEGLKPYMDEALRLLKAGEDVMVISSGVLDHAEYEASLAKGKALGLSREEVSCLARNRISEVGKALLLGTRVSGLVLSGGDTAMGLMEGLSVSMTEILAEVAIGIPLMKLVGGPCEGMYVVTKAGGFGKSDAIHYALRYLKAEHA